MRAQPEPEPYHLMRLFDAAVDLPRDQQIQYLAEVKATCEEVGSRLEALLAGARAPLDYRLQIAQGAHQRLRDRSTSYDELPDDNHGQGERLLTHTTSEPPNREGQPTPGMGISPSHPDDADLFDQLPIVERDQYLWVAELARGGMGRVSEVIDRRLGRRVVVKEPLVQDDASELQVKNAYMRLEREARITAQLHHPSIVSVHQAGRWTTGQPFFLMSKVSGIPLHHAIEQTRRLHDRLALLQNVIDLAEAVAFAHTVKIIHRDIKPQNILVGSFGETVVIDWGLAKRLDCEQAPEEPRAHPRIREGVQSPVLTQAGAALGTPAYMSPEQARGESLDERSDVYAIGAVLYHVLAGHSPYHNHSTAFSVFERVLLGAPEPVRRAAPDVPYALASIVDRAMARNVDERYNDANELAADLRRFRQGRMVAAHDYSALEIVGNWIRNRKTLVAVIMVALITLLVVGALAVREHVKRNERALSEAKLADKNIALQSAVVRAEHERQKAQRQTQRARSAEGQRTAEAQRAQAAEHKAREEAHNARTAEHKQRNEAERARHAEARAEAQKRLAEQSQREAQKRARELEVVNAQLRHATKELEEMHRREKQRADREARRVQTLAAPTSSTL